MLALGWREWGPAGLQIGTCRVSCKCMGATVKSRELGARKPLEHSVPPARRCGGVKSSSDHSTTVLCPHLPRLQILHASGHLVGTGDQGREGERSFAAARPIRAEIRAWGTPGTQEFPKVSLGRIFHNHIQGPYRGKTRTRGWEVWQDCAFASQLRNCNDGSRPHLPECRHPAG